MVAQLETAQSTSRSVLGRTASLRARQVRLPAAVEAALTASAKWLPARC
jgi:hypothetical protein